MQRPALMDVLEGRRASTRESIVRHLQRLLNARAGVLPHMEDYGLPDVARLFQGLPHSLDEWARRVQETILRFEPRIRRVEIRTEPFDRRHMDQRVRLEVVATTVDGSPLHLSAVFHGEGNVHIGLRQESA